MALASRAIIAPQRVDGLLVSTVLSAHTAVLVEVEGPALGSAADLADGSMNRQVNKKIGKSTK